MDQYEEDKDVYLDRGIPDEKPEALDLIFKAGQSKRIWNELYKVSSLLLCRMDMYVIATHKMKCTYSFDQRYNEQVIQFFC